MVFLFFLFFFWVALGFSSCNERFLDSWIIALHTEHFHRSPVCKMGVLCFCHVSERTASVVFLWNCKTTLKMSLWVYKKINLGNHYVLFVLSIMCSWSLKGDENYPFSCIIDRADWFFSSILALLVNILTTFSSFVISILFF